MSDFFRHCPSCGRRFRIKLERKKLVGFERDTTRRESTPRMTSFQFRGDRALAVQEGRPIVVDVEEFQYTYKCGHCGHEWSEKHIKDQPES